MSGWTDATWRAIIDDQFGTTVRTAPTTPMKLAQETVAGTGAAPGTEATGYTRPTITMGAASSSTSNHSASNSGALTVPFSAGQTINALAVYDSAATPVRKAFGGLTTPRTVVSGDSLAYAIGSIVFTGTNP